MRGTSEHIHMGSTGGGFPLVLEALIKALRKHSQCLVNLSSKHRSMVLGSTDNAFSINLGRKGMWFVGRTGLNNWK